MKELKLKGIDPNSLSRFKRSKYIFDQDLGKGVTMVYTVVGKSDRSAQRALERMLSRGQICEPDNPDSPVVEVHRVEDVPNGKEDVLIFKRY